MSADNRKPSKDDMQRGGFNPLPAQTSKPKDQFGPLPTDDPKHEVSDAKRRKAVDPRYPRGDDDGG